MCDFADFRTKARNTFASLVVSVMMFENGSGKGGEITMYRVKVAGMAIGQDITCQGANADDVLREAVRLVAAARKAKKDADNAREQARRAEARQPVMVAHAGSNEQQQPEPQEQAPTMKRAA